jgi:hypothetical protein
VTITRGREHRRHFLSIRDDGEGVPRDNAGRPDFRYVATHICDSVKRRLKADGTSGLQGEFGIGLLSFWTVGDELSVTSTGVDRRAYQMVMRKGDPTYGVTPMRALFGDGGTEVRIAPLLDGIRGLSGEKIQWYLAAELRDRIRQTGVRINVVDRLARKQYAVEPRQYEGRLLHQLPALRTRIGDIYAELYLSEPSDSNRVALFRHGTRVIEDLALLDDLARPPWTLRSLQGHVDAPFVNLTPARVRVSSTTRRMRRCAKRCSRSSEGSSSSLKSSAAPRKSRRARSSCARSSVRSARRCWRCRPRNMTGSTSTPARSGRYSTARPWRIRLHSRTRSTESFSGRQSRRSARTGNGSSSNSPDRFSA